MQKVLYFDGKTKSGAPTLYKFKDGRIYYFWSDNNKGWVDSNDYRTLKELTSNPKFRQIPECEAAILINER